MTKAVCIWLLVILLASLSNTGGWKTRRSQWTRESNLVERVESLQRIRLLGDKNSYQRGRILIYNGGRWGYVCGANWDIRDATVACRQLGFQRAVSASEASLHRQSRHDVVTGEMQCSGDESQLQQCRMTPTCSTNRMAGVECEGSPGCPVGWVSGLGKCYKLFPGFTVRSIEQAVKECAIENASLVSVLSPAENHFLSDLVINLSPAIHHWHTSGSLVEGTWVWSVPRDTQGLSPWKQDKELWFPGWQTHRYQYAEPTNQMKKACLTLSNQFRHPDGDMRSLNYFFWKASWCRKWQGINFICQKDLMKTQTENIDCYIGDGSGYRGNTSESVSGWPCLSWADSRYINPTTHPNKGLGKHNYCRNPDGDARPWCWVDHSEFLKRFDHCKIPRCPYNPHIGRSTTTPTHRETTFKGDIYTEPTTVTELSNTPTTMASIKPSSTQESTLTSTQDSTLTSTQNSTLTSTQDSTLTSTQDSTLTSTQDSTLTSTQDSSLTSTQDSTLTSTQDSSLNSTQNSTLTSTQDSTLIRTQDSTQISTLISTWEGNTTSLSATTTTTTTTTAAETTSSIQWNSLPQSQTREETPDLHALSTVFTRTEDTATTGHPSLSEASTSGYATTTSAINYTIELVDGEGAWEGRVEITIDGVSGTVCDDNWDDKAATVVCRSLGLNYGGIAFTGAELGRGSGPIWLDNVRCRGTEQRLDQCDHNGWNQHDCDHWQDSSVYCFKTPQTNQWETTPTTPQTNQWETTPTTPQTNQWETTPTTPQTNQWKTTPTTRTPKTTTTTLSVRRVPTTVPITTTPKETTKALPHVIRPSMLRLVGGSTPYQGNVEILISNTSYRICDDSWDDREARIVCRMLGFSAGGRATTRSEFGKGNFPIILDDLDCMGTEKSLDECPGKFGPEKHNCQISEFAGVVCFSGVFTEPNRQLCGQIPFGFLNGAGVRNFNASPNHYRAKRESLENLPRFRRMSRKRRSRSRLGPIQPKITVGVSVPYGKYPWQVNFRRISKSNGRYWFPLLCGGTIISEHWLLTAAHCFENELTRNVQVRVGDHHFYRLDKFEQAFEIEKVIPHELFDSKTLDYDIALIKVKRLGGRGILFNNFVQPACLPTASTQYRPGRMCYISGWGRTESDNPTSKARILQAAAIPLVHFDECKIAYMGYVFTRRMICAGHMRGGQDTCKGDSGGPLVCKDKGTYTLFGITSGAKGDCGDSLSPSVYSHVIKFLPWIHGKIRTHSSTDEERFLPPPS